MANIYNLRANMATDTHYLVIGLSVIHTALTLNNNLTISQHDFLAL